MATLLISDNFHSHPAAMIAPDRAIGLWVRAGSWSACHGTGGWIPAEFIYMIGGEAEEAAEELVSVGLWEKGAGGWEMVQEVTSGPGRSGVPLWKMTRDEHRAKIPAEVRQAVYERDGNACLHCGSTEDLSLDHIIPWSMGGPDTVENFQTLCRPCNSSKGARI